MGFFLITIFVIFSLGLLDFIDRSEWEELDERNASRLSSNKAYGAYKLRTTQPLTVLAIVGCTVLVLLIYFAGNAIASVNSGRDDNVIEKSSQYVDTTQFTMNIEEQLKEVPPSAFNQSGNNGDNMPVRQKGAQETSDRPEKANDYVRPEPTRKLTPEEEAREFEASLFRDAPGNEIRRKRLEEADKEKKEREERNKAKQKEINGGNGGVSGSSASTAGQASVTWKFSDNRDAYEGKAERVPVPAYTCGNSSDAKVVVQVKVDAAGKVIDAKVQSTTLQNGCITNNALQYARKSRFEPSSLPEQTGTITYIYKAQK